MMLSSSCAARGEAKLSAGARIDGRALARLVSLALSVPLHRQLAVDELTTSHHLECAGAARRRAGGDSDFSSELVADETLKRSSKFLVASAATVLYVHRHCARRASAVREREAHGGWRGLRCTWLRRHG